MIHLHPLIQKKIQLKLYTTFGIGGYARYFAETDSIENFLEVYKWGIQNQQKIFILGMGSNVVFTDEGYNGLVIRYTARRFTFQHKIAVVEAAMSLSALILEAEKHNLGGMEKLFGIPGSVGGAIYNNAGAHETEIGKFVESALIFEVPREVELSAMRLLDPYHISLPKPRIVKPDYFKFGYRESVLHKTRAIVLSTTIEFKNCPKEKIQKVREDISIWRREKQPVGKSAGSFFKNPSLDISAGYLLDQVGAKGMQEGGIMVSEKHANFLINTGRGTFADLQKLTHRLQNMVEKTFKIKLEKEVAFIV